MNTKIIVCLKVLSRLGFDSILISDPANIEYLTGFKDSSGYLLLTSKKSPIYFTNFLYMKAAKKIKDWDVIVSGYDESVFSLITKEIKKLKHEKVAFEAKKIPFLEHKTINNMLSKIGIHFCETKDIIENIRMIKSPEEISLICKSIEISKEALQFIKEIRPQDFTEKDLGIETEKFLRLKGDNELAFAPIVAAGKNTVLPHHKPTNKIIGSNFFLIDLGSKHCGYCADLTRLFFWGKMSSLFRKIYETIKKAQDISIKRIKDGVKASEVDSAAREFIDKKGWGKYFGHGLGHGLGLSVHEPPFIQPNNDEILKEGMVITIEPAIYYKNMFGIRIEDMILVKKEKGKILSGHIDR